MRLAKRLTLTLAAAMLAALLSSAPSAHAAGSYSCFFGSRTATQNGYDISAQSCDGAGYVDVGVTVLGGSAAGSHRCRTAFSWNGFLSATGCTRE